MKSLFIYGIESIVCTGLLLVFYRMCLVHAVSFRANRRFLLIGTLWTCFIPMCRIPVWPVEEWPADGWVVAGAKKLPLETYTLNEMGLVFSITITCILLTMLLVRMRRINRLRIQSGLLQKESYVLALNEKVKNPFSFGRTLFMAPHYTVEERSYIVAHEVSHIRHRHSRERIWMEVLKAVCWFNPFVWLAARYLSEVQELEADADVLHEGGEVNEYRKVLLKLVLGVDDEVVCGLGGRPLKERFLSMNLQRKPQNNRIWFSVPLLAAMMLFAFTTRLPSMPAGEIPVQSGTFPLMLVDGKPLEGSMGDIPSQDIESIRVLDKDLEPYIEKYGNRAEKGILLISLKK